ncbi:MAG: phenylacetate--CoA ligase family protein, partial [Bacteroidota bacterium]
CSAGNGGHLQPGLLIVELLDENNQPVPENMPGEVTITTLGVEAMPLLRYKTGDICMKFESPCECGRTSLRLSPIIGRRKQMIKFKGTTLYPAALFDLLTEMKDVRDFVVEVFQNEIGMDEVLIYIVPAGNDKACDHRIRAHLQASLRVSPQLAYVSEKEIQAMQMPESGRKAVKFIDKRIS